MKGTMSNDNHTITFYFHNLLKNIHLVSGRIMDMYSCSYKNIRGRIPCKYQSRVVLLCVAPVNVTICCRESSYISGLTDVS